MKIEKNKSKKNVGDLPTITQELIHLLLSCPDNELVEHLHNISVWRYGKCELYHWIEVLDRFDAILSSVTSSSGDQSSAGSSLYMCPLINDDKVKELILAVLNFTSLLIEHSYARHIYNSTEHLCVLLASPDLDIVLAVLNLFYVFGKRSNFISRLPAQQRNSLNSYLEYLGETWGGKQNGFGLAQCCQDLPLSSFPDTATSVYFEYQPTDTDSIGGSESRALSTKSISVTGVDQCTYHVSTLMTQLLNGHNVPTVQQMRLLTRLRLAKNFNSFEYRVKCVLVRLQAISVLVYSMAPAEVVDPLIYDGLVEELIEVLEVKNPYLLQEVKAAVLRTLTAIIHLERDPRLGVIIEATGASTYHGFLPTLVRDCVAAITTAGPDGSSPDFPLSFATSLFSFLYHLATYEASGDALVNSGIMESLLQVLDWKAIQPMNITLVTRAVRVVDLITNLDMSAFHSLGGWDKMLNRLKEEVEECKRDVPHLLSANVRPTETPPTRTTPTSGATPSLEQPLESMDTNEWQAPPTEGSEGLQCMPERSALIKSILNFVKKAVPDPTFTENIRNLVDSSLPGSLAHIASNAEYYGPSIYLPATEVTTTFIFHDPSQLSSLQDNGLPWVILNSLINKKIPVTREVLSALPSILSAICLNTRGLQIFIDAEPFDHLFGVLISPDYLPAMRRKRGTDFGDTATSLGTAMDELMRHQPLLKTSVMIALVRLLKKLCQMGSNLSHCETTTSSHKGEGGEGGGRGRRVGGLEEGITSDEEELFEDKGEEGEEGKVEKSSISNIPLTEYTLNVVNFVDAILINNSTDDHINEFIKHGGLKPLLSLLSLPALPLTFPTSSACNSITTTFKSMLNLAQCGQVLGEALQQLSDVLVKLKPFIDSPDHAKESVLLHEINSYVCPEQSQLLHNLSAAGSYIQLFIQLSKCSQVESRQICIEFWASTLGQSVLSQLSKLYRSLVWEGFIVLAVASTNDSLNKDTAKGGGEATPTTNEVPGTSNKGEGERGGEGGGGGERLKLSSFKMSLEETDKSIASALVSFTPPLVVTSRVGRSLAEFMSLLVRLCTGPLHRFPRRGPYAPPYVPPSDNAITVSMKITDLFLESLTWSVPTPAMSGSDVLSDSDMRKWLFSGMTFKMYAVDFCLLLLFDEHKQAYHLMLHAFSQKNVLDALINSFYSAMECIDAIQTSSSSSFFTPDFAVTSDFLEAWLNLAEKLINASAILESSHSLPVPPPSLNEGGKKLMFNPLFNPLEFVIKAQKAIFPCIQRLWQSINVKWMMPEVTEHLLTTIKHLYSSEKVLETKLAEFRGDVKSKSSSSLPSAASGSGTAPFVPRADPLHLQQLMDMGFDHSHAEEALLATGNNLPASMEWILTHPPSTSVTNRVMSEEEQLAQAIALSLEPSTATTDDPPLMEQERKGEEEEDSLQPIDSHLLTKFSEELIDGVLSVVPYIEDSVYKTCDLVTSLCYRNGSAWRDNALGKVKRKAYETITDLMKRILEGSYEVKTGSLDPDSFHVCLLALLMEEMPLVSATVLCTPDLLDLTVSFLVCVQEKFPSLKRTDTSRLTPMWVPPLLLMLELWQGIETLITWHRQPHKSSNAVWLWFESMNSRWCYFGTEISRTLETAYREGEPMARIQSARQGYVIQFNTMTQINLDTNTQRPVLRLELPRKKEGNGNDEQDIKSPLLSSYTRPEWFHSFTKEQSIAVVRSCTHLLSVDLEPDTLHANMRLLLSLTRNPLLSNTFMEERGPHALLKLTKKSNFNGFSSLSTLLFRHILENGPLLEKGLYSIVRSVISGSIPDTEFKAHGPGRRDLDYVLRRLGPCVTRDKDLFVNVFCQVARLTNTPPRVEDYQTTQRIPPIVLKVNPTIKNEVASLTRLQENLINLLVDHLCANAFLDNAKDGENPAPHKIDEESFDSISMPQYGSLQNPRVRRSSYRRQVTDDDMRSEDMVLDSDQIHDLSESSNSMRSNRQSSSRGDPRKVVKEQPSDASLKEVEEESKEHLLFSQAAILRLLAEMIESYPSTARLIIESTRKIKIDHQSHVQTTKEISIVAFVLDHLLPVSYTHGNAATQVAKLAKVFLQCLATTNLPTDALTVFVTEFRASFTRALLMQESLLKHHRIRALAGLLGQIVEPQTGSSSRSAINPSQFIRMLIRKGFITDLAKAIHSLDLSTPLLTPTVNSILKPLECLTKIVSQYLAAQKRANLAAAASSSSSGSQQVQQRRDIPATTDVPSSINDVTSSTVSFSLPPPPTVSTTAPLPSTDSTDVQLHDNSLIPLQGEEEGGHHEEVEESVDQSQEGFVLEPDLIMAGGERGEVVREEGDDDEEEEMMELEEIVDELLESGPAAVGLFEESNADLHSESGGSDDEIDDNINSAGEEIDDDFDVSQNESYYRPPRQRRDHIYEEEGDPVDQDAPSTDEEASNTSSISTDIVEEEEEEEEDLSDNDRSITNITSNANDTMANEEEEEDFQLGEEEEGVDETFDIEGDFDGDDEREEREEEEEGDMEEDDDEDEDEDGLELDYNDDMDMFGGPGGRDSDMIHVEFPSWYMGWRDGESIDSGHLFTSFPSNFLSRAYHIRASLSDGPFPSGTLPSLPRQHPILIRRSNNSTVGGASGRSDPSPPDVQRSNIVQQLLTNISTSVGMEEVLSFSVGGATSSNLRTNANSLSLDPVVFPTERGGGGGATNNIFTDTLESTFIPNNLSRWREESQALDGHTIHLCITALRPIILNILKEELHKQKKQVKESQSTATSIVPPPPPVEAPPSTDTPTNTSTSAPNPSDEATPSMTTPRNGSESIEQLQSSLRAVADALAQTVTEVRNMDETPSHDHVAVSHDHVGVSHDHVGVSRSVASMPDLSTFDGTQDSALDMLTRISSDDPLFTFLSAVARAPTPPLPETESPQAIPPSSSAPRLPVFTQLLPPLSTTSTSNTTESPVAVIPVIQYPPTTTNTITSSPAPIPVSTQPLTTAAPTVQSTGQSSQSSGQTHSNVLDTVPSQISQSVLAGSNFADVLANELIRAISDHLPPPSSSHSSLSVPPHVITSSNSNNTTGSPSPSDTLAPLMSSLQMPPPSTTVTSHVHVISSPSSQQSDEDGGGKSAAATIGSPATDEGGQSTSAEGSSTTSSTNNDMQTEPPPTQSNEVGGAVGGVANDLPDGIDPTFLAALPDSIRQEVLAQYERERSTNRAITTTTTTSAGTVAAAAAVTTTTTAATINPEVLAALPPDIQEEVIQQQRIEQARQSQLQVDPSQPADAMSFFTSLTPELRRTVLSDMDDTLISQLPEEIAVEARAIRQDRETRRQQIIAQHQAHMASRMIPSWSHSVGSIPLPTQMARSNLYRYILSPGDHLSGLLPSSFTTHPMQRDIEAGSKQMLDQDGLACLLVLLFLDQNKLHLNRLFRIFRSLSSHLPSRSWLIASLLAIVKDAHFTPLHTCPLPPTITPGTTPTSGSKATPTPGQEATPTNIIRHAPHWLTVNINAALGSHAPVFQFSSQSGKGQNHTVHIHPHASISVCNNVLDLLIFLARQFPSSFLPSQLLPNSDKTSLSSETSNSSQVVSNFWSILFKLDSLSSRKGKSSVKSFQYSSDKNNEEGISALFTASPVGQLMSLFNHPIIQGSVTLVDKLLRVLSVISGAIPKQGLVKNTDTKTTPTSAQATPIIAQATPTSAQATPTDTNMESNQGNSQTMSSVTPPTIEATPTTDTPTCFSTSVVSVSLLQSTIKLLTSGKCSEDTLDDATSLLINLSRCGISTRETILLILLDGITSIGFVLYDQISTLLSEVIKMMPTVMQSNNNSEREEDMMAALSSSSSGGGMLGTVEGVVLPTVQGVRSNIDHSSDLHLSCMEPLVAKGSQQSFFLRLLKIVCQLRESAQTSTTVLTPMRTLVESTTPVGVRLEGRFTIPIVDPSNATNNRREGEEGEGERRQGREGEGEEREGGERTEGDRTEGERRQVEENNDSNDDQVVPGSTLQHNNPQTTTNNIKQQQLTLPPLTSQLDLEELWSITSECLDALAATYDPHAVLALQPTVEAFFLVHAEQAEIASIPSSDASRGRRRGLRPSSRRLPSFHTISDTESIPGSPAHPELLSPVPSTPFHNEATDGSGDMYSHLPPDTARFLKFAERHRTVLNQILRQTTVPLSEGPFAILVNYTRLLDFDVKRRYFRQELEQLDEGLRKEDLVVHIRRSHVFEDSYRELYRRSPEELKANLYITFDGEEGQDAGGLLREWYIIIAREMFNPNYALFKTTPGDRVTYMPNPSSHINPEHLNYFKFVGRIIAKAIYDNKLLDCYFTRSFYKHILGKPVHYTDMESEDYSFYQGMVYLLEHDINEAGLELTFSTEIEEFGKTETRDLKPSGRDLPVLESNKREYVQLACQMKMTGSVRSQIKSFLEGFYDVIPKNLISIFNEQELELLISGLPNIDIDDLKANCEYHKYTESSLQIQWFWRSLRSCNQADRARFLQFITGTSKVPLQGFAALEGMNGIQKFQIHRDDRSTDRLPSAHTCFNQLDLPPYETYDKLNQMLLIAIRECPEGFGFA